jgi:hypothetical protein
MTSPIARAAWVVDASWTRRGRLRRRRTDAHHALPLRLPARRQADDTVLFVQQQAEAA